MCIRLYVDTESRNAAKPLRRPLPQPRQTIQAVSPRPHEQDIEPPILLPARQGRQRCESQLRGTLVDFGYDARSSSVVVTFDAVRDVNGTQVMTRRFSATVPGVTPEAAPVGAALNRAANDVAGQVADWVG